MQLAIGPFIPTADPSFPDGLFALPAGVRSALELHGPDTAANPHAVFRADNGVRLPRELTILGDDAKSRDAIESVFGRRPQGATLEQWLVDMLRSGDPSGQDRCFPSMPMTEGVLRFRFGEYLRDEPFRFGQHPHTNQVQAVLQRDFREMAQRELARTGKADHSRRVLDYWCEKYRLDKADPAQWRMLVPPDLRSEIAGPLRHATTLTESFNKSDGAGWGPDLTWTQATGSISTVSNQATGGSNPSAGWHSETVSSADHYSECDAPTKNSTSTQGNGPGARHTGSSTQTYYWTRLMGSTNNNIQLFRVNTGTATSLVGNTAVTLAGNNRLRLRCNGDQIDALFNGSLIINETNNNITGGTAGAMRVGNSGTLDNYEISDLGAPPAAEGSGVIEVEAELTGEGFASVGSGFVEAEAELTGSGIAAVGSGVVEAEAELVGFGIAVAGSGTAEAEVELVGASIAATGSGIVEANVELVGSGVLEAGEGSGIVEVEVEIVGAGIAPSGSGSIEVEAAIAGSGVAASGSGTIEVEAELVGAGTVVSASGSGVIEADVELVGVGAEAEIEIPDTAWQYWGPLLLMQDDGVAFAQAIGMSSRIHGAVVLERVSVRGAVVLQSSAVRSTVQ